MGCKTLYLFHRNLIYIINHLLVYVLCIPHHYGTKNKDETSTLRINYSKKKTVEVLSAKSFSPVTETAQLLVRTDIFQKQDFDRYIRAFKVQKFEGLLYFAK